MCPVQILAIVGRLGKNQPMKRSKEPLSVTHPELAKQAYGWDPSSLTRGSDFKREWTCDFNHIWTAAISGRVGGNGCPYCSGRAAIAEVNDLLTLEPEIASEADGWDPKSVSLKSNLKKEWSCRLGHRWNAVVSNRTNGNGCPYCSGRVASPGVNDLLTTDPELARQANGWDPTSLSRSSNLKKSWKCQLDHVWVSTIDKRTLGRGCPYCAGKKVLQGFNDLVTSHPEIAAQAEGWDPTLFNKGSDLKKNWKCELGHVWNTRISHRTMGIGCPSCSQTGFDPNLEGWLYFLTHSDWEMFQIGITNVPDNRLGKHKSLGWEVMELRGPMDGHLTQQWETAILRMLKATGADLSNGKIAGKFDGYSEAWSQSTFQAKSIKELMQLTEEYEESELKIKSSTKHKRIK